MLCTCVVVFCILCSAFCNGGGLQDIVTLLCPTHYLPLQHTEHRIQNTTHVHKITNELFLWRGTKMILMGQTHLESNWKGGGGSPENLDF
jgi:hypothetical protein